MSSLNTGTCNQRSYSGDARSPSRCDAESRRGGDPNSREECSRRASNRWVGRCQFVLNYRVEMRLPVMKAPEPRRVLIATIALTARTGTAVYTRDLAFALLRRGHLPIVYASQTGPLAEELRHATIPVVTDLDAVAAPPDVIHGHHQLETLTALTRFPRVPALFVCHDRLTWHSIPPIGPRIGLSGAVDRNCRDRMVFEHGIPKQSIHLLTNSVDMRRFTRRSPLPSKPPPAFAFHNNH